MTHGTRGSRLSDAAVALSLANLILARVWADILTDKNNTDLLARVDYFVGMLNVLLVAGGLWAAIRAVRRLSGPWVLPVANVAFAWLLAYIAYLAHHIARPDVSIIGRASLTTANLLYLGCLAAIAFLAVRQPRCMARTMVRAALTLLPFAAMTFGQALWGVATHSPQPSFTPPPPLARAPHRGTCRLRPRVVVVLFDEMQQRFAFWDRPATLKLPELDRLCSQSVACGNVFPPAGGTDMSVPAMLTGRLVEYGTRLSSGHLRITFQNERVPCRLDECHTFFHDAKRMGCRTAICTGVFPYERLVPGQAEYISPRLPQRHSHSVSAAFWRQWRRVMCFLPKAGELRLDERLPKPYDLNAYIHGYADCLKDMNNVLTADPFDLIWVHLPTPHPPAIYDRFRGVYCTSRTPPLNYLDGLAMVDRTLGEFRAAMEAAGQWDSVTLLIISDHWWRQSPFVPGRQRRDHRIPYILKLPGQQRAVRYDRPFNGLVTHDLILALLRGEVTRPEDATAWLDQHRTFAESPLTMGLP